MNKNSTDTPAPAPALNLDQFEGFTPGPWTLGPADNVAGWKVDGAGGVIVADVLHLAGPTAFGPTRVEESRANAALIAAAPALLAECRRQQQDIEQLRAALQRIANHEYRADRRQRGMVDVEEVESLRRVARAALAQEAAHE